MNNMAFICEIEIDRSCGLAGTDMAGLNRALRRKIDRPRAYTQPMELAARARVGRLHGQGTGRGTKAPHHRPPLT
jgi:hypothetical protein